MTCPECREDAKFVGYRKTTLISLLGKLTYERAYYRCEHCRHTWFPTDEELRVTRQKTQAAEEVISLAGTLQPFEESAHEVLRKFCGLLVSKSTVHTTTETAGTALAEHRAAGETVGPEEHWDWQRDSQGKTVAYVSLDATGVRQQGPKHEKAEGRMAWVGTVFNAQPTHEEKRRRLEQARYVSGLMSLPEIGKQIRRECQAVGLARADRVIGLTDGGNGIENCLLDAVAGQAKDIQFILDFFHVSDHLKEFAKLRWPSDETARTTQVEAWCHTLKHRGGAVLLAELEAFDVASASKAVRESHRQLLGYLQSNLHRTDYPTYVKNGWQIGSGVMESACKSVVGCRLKGPGMRWRPAGTTALCQLRALYKSKGNLWDHYWRHAAAP